MHWLLANQQAILYLLHAVSQRIFEMPANEIINIKIYECKVPKFTKSVTLHLKHFQIHLNQI